MRWDRRAWLLLGLGTALGCAVDLAMPAGSRVTCRAVADCPAATVCGPQGLCVDPRAPSATLVPGFQIQPQSGLVTSESGGADSFTVALTAAPTATVSLSLEAANPDETLVTPSFLVFGPADWDRPQRVTVTGVLDCLADGDHPFSIVIPAARSGDPAYDGLEVPDVQGTNRGDREARIVVSPTTGLITNESGSRAFFSVVLACPTRGTAELSLASSDETEGRLEGSGILTFNEATWSTAQTVTVLGQSDCAPDGDVVFAITGTTSSVDDDAYDGLEVPQVTLTNEDQYAAGVLVSPIAGLSVREDGGRASFVVALTCAPTADVRLGLWSSDETEATVSPSYVMFTPADWREPRLLVVTGVADCERDGDRSLSILTGTMASADLDYDGLPVDDVEVVTLDTLEAGMSISPDNGATSESGTLATFSLTLTCAPLADVAVPLAIDDPSEGDLSPSVLTFTPDNWYVPQGITINGVDDALDDGDQSYVLLVQPATSTDLSYADFDGPDASLINTDDDGAGFVVTPIGPFVPSTTILRSTEAGQSPTFTVRLTAQPAAAVTIPLSSTVPTEATPSPSSLVFDGLNWQSAQTVTLSPVNDNVDDGDISYTINLAPAVSADPAYDSLDPVDVLASNQDNDTAELYSTPTTGNRLYTNASGTTATFRVWLGTAPTADVTVAVSSDHPDEATASVTELVFTPTAYGNQTVTVTGRALGPVDGWQDYLINVGPAVSADPKYAGQVTWALGYNLDAGVKRIFMTAVTVSSRLGQATNGDPSHADAICEADVKPTAGTYKALIAECADGNQAHERVAMPQAPCLTQKNWVLRPNWGYALPDGTTAFARTNANANWQSALVATLQPQTTNYWTGLDPDFTLGTSCSGWTTTSGSADIGRGGAGWTSAGPLNCNSLTAHLLCVEQ
ncbi:MAG: DUF1554 domain-containing protein [Deltaproteobacteria bacterium]|nr:DUF1554 domain-containing protein [Deltaproteobacteria bacterium]